MMADKRVFLTGAQGFTARFVIPRLQSRGYTVHGLVRPGAGETIQGVIDHPGDLQDLSGLSKLIAQTEPDIIIHLAAIPFVAHGNAREIYETNLIGSRNLLQAIADSSRIPSAVLLASSANIYGNRHQGALDEDTLPDPVNDYAVSKLAMEMAARLFSDRIPLTIVRPFNYVGVGQSVNFLIPKIVDHARRGADTIELGNINVARDFSDVRSVAEAYVALAEQPSALGRTFNICSGRAYSLRAVLDMVEEITGRAMRIEINPALVRANEVASLYGDNRRLIETIGPLKMPPLNETLRWMIEQ